jgi:hypothetical protein
LLAQPTNSGHLSKNHFAVLPEIGIKVGYQVTDNVRVYVGWDFLYASSVVRPGDQIDRSVNTNQLLTIAGPGSVGNGPARPAPTFKPTDFWAFGVNAGLEWRF